MSRRRRHRRHYKALLRNPSTSTWLMIAGGVAVAAYLFWPKKAAAASGGGTLPPGPVTPPAADCMVGLDQILKASSAAGAMYVGVTQLTPDQQKNADMARKAAEQRLTAWAIACGKPQPSSPVMSAADCLSGRVGLLQQMLSALPVLQAQCAAAPGTKPCTDADALYKNLAIGASMWAAGCAKTAMPLTQ